MAQKAAKEKERVKMEARETTKVNRREKVLHGPTSLHGTPDGTRMMGIGTIGTGVVGTTKTPRVKAKVAKAKTLKAKARVRVRR